MRATEYLHAVSNGVQGDDALLYSHIDIVGLWPDIKVLRADLRKIAKKNVKNQMQLF